MSSTQDTRPLYGKILLNGLIILETGLHIGGAREALEIGGLDAPVVRDPVTRYPYIPGSSLKGKMRSLFERSVMADLEKKGQLSSDFLQRIGQVRIHVCDRPNCVICRLYGSSTRETNIPSRLVIRDAHITENSKRILEEIESPLLYTELKWENAIDRITSAAMPRQIERVPAGTEFVYEAVYNVENLDQLEEDLRNFLKSMILLEEDYLGGHGSRGYGKIRFKLEKIVAKKVEAYAGEIDGNVLEIEKELVENWREKADEIIKKLVEFFKGAK
ncbi:MAG: type III-A CRISPR-associated RAMP protein Csm3 [Candidatus Njordarchaeales archaeon]